MNHTERETCPHCAWTFFHVHNKDRPISVSDEMSANYSHMVCKPYTNCMQTVWFASVPYTDCTRTVWFAGVYQLLEFLKNSIIRLQYFLLIFYLNLFRNFFRNFSWSLKARGILGGNLINIRYLLGFGNLHVVPQKNLQVWHKLEAWKILEGSQSKSRMRFSNMNVIFTERDKSRKTIAEWTFPK